jgi:hypothetical protein
MCSEDRLKETIKHLYELTYPAEGLDDYIFFNKKEAREHLNEKFPYIDLKDPDDSDDNEKYQEILNSIEEMKYFIAFKSGEVEKYYVDDYSKYARELARQIIEDVDVAAYELELGEIHDI